MRLDSVALHNIGPFEHFEVDLRAFGDALLVAIVGENGAGKSSFLEFALPGVMFRSCPTQGDLLDRARARDSYVESRLTNGKTYRIRHSIDALNRKGESLVLDEHGAPVLKTTSNKAYDAWAERHMPAPSVFFCTEFWAQKSEGFIGEKKGARKAILLRTLGIEHYEGLAEKARQHRTRVENEIGTLQARIDDLGAPAVTAAAALSSIDLRVVLEAQAAEELAKARSDVELAKLGAPALEVARREAKAAREKRADLAMRIKATEAGLADVEGRIRNNRTVLAEGDAIRAAKARSDELAAELADVEKALAATSQRRMAAIQEATHAGEAERAAIQRAFQAEKRFKDAWARLQDRAKVDEAAADLDRLSRALRAADVAVLEAEAQLEQVRAERVAGADERIAGLRGGLQAVCDIFERSAENSVDEEMSGTAMRTLDEDNARVTAAAELPGRLKTGEGLLRVMRRKADEARRALEGATLLAARAAELDAAARELEQAKKDIEAAQAEALGAEATKEAANATAEEHQATANGQRQLMDALRQEQAGLATMAAKAGPLANAEGRLAELEPVEAHGRKALADLQAQLAAVPEPPAEPVPPDVARLEDVAGRAEDVHRAAVAAVAEARGWHERALEAQAKVDELEGQTAALEHELADWTKLALDLGRDGLQSLEIDAAGPELTELVNDLMRASFGTRFTLSIETTRASSDGKRELDDCLVRVIDTEKGRDDDARLFSGGEKVLLGEAFSLALTMLACRRTGVERPTLVRDESGAALSEENGRRYIAMLRRAAQLIGADRVLFVTHSRELAEMADAQLHVPSRPSGLTAATLQAKAESAA